MKTFPLVFIFTLIASGLPLFTPEGLCAPTPLEKAEELIKASKSQDALSELSSYRPTREELSAYHYAYARALAQARKSYEAIEHYRLAFVYAASEPDKERLLLERAEVYAGMGYSSEAVMCFEVFLKQFPRSNSAERAELGIAESRYRLGDYRAALQHFEKAGSALRAMYGKANALQALGKTAEAHGIYRQLIENDPEVINSSQETLYNIGENYRQTGALGDAKIFFISVKDDIMKYRAETGLGLIAMQESLFDEAVTHFTAAAESPERQVKSEAVLKRAEANMRIGKYDEAEAALLEVKNKHPYGKEFETASLLLVKLYRARGKFDEAVSILKALIYRRTPSAAALDELEAIMFEAMKKDRNAFVKLWDGSGRWLLDPSRSVALVKLARGLRGSGKPLIDISAWLIRYGAEDAKVEGRLLLADFYAGIGDTASAWGYLNRVKIRGRGDEVLRIKAKAYAVDHDAVKAARALMALREPREADLLLLLDVMKSAGNRGEVLSFLARAVKRTPLSPPASVRVADVLYDAGRTGDALEYYRAATSGTAKPAMTGDIAWAHYRISALAGGETGTSSLKAVEAGNTTLGRFASAELKAASLRKRVEWAGK